MLDVNEILGQIVSDADTVIKLGLMFAFVLVVSFGGAFLKRMAKRKRRTKAKQPFRSNRQPNESQATDLSDPANQLRFVAKVNFVCRPLLNREERPLLTLIDATVRGLGKGHRVMAQTSLGEVLKPDTDSGTAQDRHMAFKSINSKRLDFAVFDEAGNLMLAVEYQGSGHYHETSFMRDAVKREALRKAGIPMIEVPESYVAAVVEQQILLALGGPSSAVKERRIA